MDDGQALDIATRAAFRAGRLAPARTGNPGYLQWKGHRDVVSGASLEAHDAMVPRLQNACAGDGILVEEGPEDEPLPVAARRLWSVHRGCGSLTAVQAIS